MSANLHSSTPAAPPQRTLRRRRPLWMRMLIMFTALLVVSTALFLYWALNTAAPMAEALTALQSTDQVKVTQERWLLFQPVDQKIEHGLIFYPGARVDPRAYAPMGHALAQAGIVVAIPAMPLNLAILAPNRAQKIIDASPGVSTWAVGGHSLGGTMSAAFAESHADAVQQLVLLAAYPPESSSLAAHTELAVLSIYGTADGLVSRQDIENARALLPPNTQYVPIEGGNHAQFGWYGAQSGDQPATIDRASQQAQTLQALQAFLQKE